jgi:hypothetical protein
MSVAMGTSSGFFGWRVVWASFVVAVFAWGAHCSGHAVGRKMFSFGNGYQPIEIPGGLFGPFFPNAH